MQEIGVARAAGRKHISADRLGDLHRDMADPARARIDQYGLAHLKRAFRNQRLPRGLPDQRQGRGFRVAEARGLRRDQIFMRHVVLGVGALRADGGHVEHRVARLEA